MQNFVSHLKCTSPFFFAYLLKLVNTKKVEELAAPHQLLALLYIETKTGLDRLKPVLLLVGALNLHSRN